MKLDVSDFDSVRSFANEVKSKYPKIKILINNAGIYDPTEPGGFILIINTFKIQNMREKSVYIL